MISSYSYDRQWGTWYNIKRYINRFKDGSIIKRKLLLKQRECQFFNEDFSHEYGTVDVYRRYLTKAGYLKRVGQGLYEKVKHIPIRISRRDVQRQGYDVSGYAKGW